MNEQHDSKKGHNDEKGKTKPKQKERCSPSSSPTHEFSFTISLHQSNSPPSNSALDLSPADEIFFHGHLLPLRLLSHLSRSSVHSNDINTFTLPVKKEEEEEEEKGNKTSIRLKSKPFSFFGLQPRRRKGSTTEVGEKEEREKKRRKLSFNMSHVIRRYMRAIRPLLSIRGKRENGEIRGKPHSFSSYFIPKKKREERGRGVSAPVSSRTSPRNSGKHLATNGLIPSHKSDSTIEELQAAIQAAIAHCKHS